jgi:hypothetical protein
MGAGAIVVRQSDEQGHGLLSKIPLNDQMRHGRIFGAGLP